MKKGIRAQVTVFIIVGLLIIGGVVFYFNSYTAKRNVEYFSQEGIKFEVDNIYASIITCLEEVGIDGLEVIENQGGYYEVPLKYLDVNDLEDFNESGVEGFVPYYYYEGEYFMPEREEIVGELTKYVDDNLDDCFDDFDFPGFELSYGNFESDVGINNEAVVFGADVKFKIEREGRKVSFDLSEYPVVVNSALSDILDVAEYITGSHKVDSKMYCISCVDDMAEEKDVYIQMIDLGDDSLMITIGENRTFFEPYYFSFLNKYTGEEVSDDFVLSGEGAEGLPSGEMDG